MSSERQVFGLILLTILIALPLALSGEDIRLPETRAVVAQLEVQPTRVQWLPQAVDYERLVLTVAGPGDVYIRREFGPGETPSFSSLEGPDGGSLDGVYAYELRVIKAPGGDRLEGPLVQSGHLWIRGGSFVDKPSVPPASPPQNEPALKAPDLHPLAKDVVHNDDLVVVGHACIGTSCTGVVPGDPGLTLKEDFGFQIKFDGINCCLPSSRDWAIQANDTSASNGDFLIRDLSSARIPFRIGANAPENALTIFFNGNLGLGTLTPAQDIHAMSSNSPAIRLEQDGTGGLTPRTWDVGANNSQFFVRDVTNSSSLPFQINAGAPSNSLVVGSNSRVGIGTASPAVSLDVKANTTGQAAARLQNSSATGYSAIEYLDSSGDVDLFFGVDNINSTTRLNSINSNPIVILTNSSERARITPAGDVGIGTSIPASKLHVNGGDIRVSGGSFIDDGTTLNVPDYVFDPSYKLMPLQELASFVTEKRHLPNVPNAEDVQRDGLNLSDFPIRLLEKVEELALYTINQQKQIDGLMAENAELKARLAALEEKSQ